MKTLLLALMGLWALEVQATQPDMLDLSGFATLGMVVTDRNDSRFSRVGFDHPGDQNPDFGPDSVLGLQANWRFSSQAAAVLQVLSRESPRGSYTPRPTLAFFSYQLDPALTVRLGRMRGPFFMFSDTIDINYAQPWIRSPIEVYGLNPYVDLDGVDLLYRARSRHIDIEVHPYFGTSRIDVFEDGESRLKRIIGVNLALSSGDLSVHAGYSTAEQKLQWRDPLHDWLQDALRRTEGGVPIAEQMSGGEGRARFASAGFQWDNGRWLLIGEYARREVSRHANNAHGWYLTAGRRFGAVVPYLTFARQIQDEPIVDNAPAAELGAAIDAFNASRNLAQRSVTAGVRWDFSDNAALKAELMRADTADGASGSFYARETSISAPTRGRTLNVLSLSIDVTF